MTETVSQEFVVVTLHFLKYNKKRQIMRENPKEYSFIYPANEWDKLVRKHGKNIEYLRIIERKKFHRQSDWRAGMNARLISVKSLSPDGDNVPTVTIFAKVHKKSGLGEPEMIKPKSKKSKIKKSTTK